MKAGMRSQPVAPEEEILSHSPCVSPKAHATRTAVLFFGATHLRNEQKSTVADNDRNHEHTKQVREIGQPEHSHLRSPSRWFGKPFLRSKGQLYDSGQLPAGSLKVVYSKPFSHNSKGKLAGRVLENPSSFT